MKDPADNRTPDLAGELKRRPGRPKKYVSDAERQAAYRKRQAESGNPVKRVPIAPLRATIRELQEQLAILGNAGSQPAVEAALAELGLRLQKRIRQQVGVKALPQLDMPKEAIMGMAWVEQGQVEEIQRVLTNLRKAVGAIRELNNQIVRNSPGSGWLQEVIGGLGQFDGVLQNAKGQARLNKLAREAARKERERQEIECAIAKLFQGDASLGAADRWIGALIALDGPDGAEWLKQRHGTQNALIGLCSSAYHLNALRMCKDAAKIRETVAAEYLFLLKKGFLRNGDYGTYWHAGRDDVEAWVGHYQSQ